MPLAGLEPATQGLGIPCSIHTELQGHLRSRRIYLKAADFSNFGLLAGAPFEAEDQPLQALEDGLLVAAFLHIFL